MADRPVVNGPRLDLRFRVRRRSGARPDRPALRRALTAALANEGIDGDVLATLSFVDEDEIRGINAEHRSVDRVTDVLSFSLVEGTLPDGSPVDDIASPFAVPTDQPRELGDIVICHARAVEQAAEYGHSLQREIAYLAVHGLLHILGYDHQRPDEQEVMRAKEEAALAAVGLTRDGPE